MRSTKVITLTSPRAHFEFGSLFIARFEEYPYQSENKKDMRHKSCGHI